MTDIIPKRFKCKCGCGKFVRPNYIREVVPNEKIKGWTKDGKIIGIEGYGYLNNGIFNTLRCGFRWATQKIKLR